MKEQKNYLGSIWIACVQLLVLDANGRLLNLASSTNQVPAASARLARSERQTR